MAHLNLGLTYASLGSKEKAVKILEAIEHIEDDGLKDPKTHFTTQVTALFNAGKLLLELGRASEAVTLLRKAENRGKAVNYQAQGILNVLGEALQALNKTTEAELSFQAALAAKPDHIPAYLTYGKLLAKNVSEYSKMSRRRVLFLEALWKEAFSRISSASDGVNHLIRPALGGVSEMRFLAGKPPCAPNWRKHP